MNKRGLSTVVTTVILVAIVFSLIAIIVVVVKNIWEKPNNIESCSDVFEKISINSKYTYYNQSSNELQFSISVGNINVDEVLVTISGEGTTKTLTITNKAQTISGLTAYQSGSKIKLPGKNTCLTYIYDMRGFSNKPDSIELSPIMGGAQCEVCDSLYEIDTGTVENSSCAPDYSCASNTCVGSNCPNGCGGTCAGTLKPDCGTRECGEAPNSCGSANECGTCNENYTCNANNGTCVKASQTCAQLGGTICTGEQYCSGTILDALDSTRCCDASCEEPVCTSCDTCGNGLFNICDRQECYACTSDTCYFIDGVDCFSCTGATCTDYGNDQQTCSDNPCGLTDCVWDGSGLGNCVYDDSDVTTVESGHTGYYTLGAGETQYFKFVAGVSDCQHPIQVGNTPGGTDQPTTVHMLIKRGSKPTIADFERTWEMAPSDYDCDLKMWIPAKPGAENLYWKYNIGHGTEFVQIKESMEPQAFYIMLYNDGEKIAYGQILSLKVWS